MTREEAINEINKVFTSAYANYIVTALTEGATVSDKEQGTAYIQAIYTEALEEGIRCAMCTNTIKSDTGCDGGCIVDAKMYNKVMTEINSRLLRRPPATPQEPRWIPVTERLPKSGEYVGNVAKYYLVQNEYGDMLVARYTHSECWEQMYHFKPISDEIVAWMPLPQPYKAESEEV